MFFVFPRNGIKYPGEIHFVYVNPTTNQTAVLGIFMKSLFLNNETENNTSDLIDEETRMEWQRFFNVAQTLKQENNSTVFNLSLELLMGENLHDFWRYRGSLTTPPCTEGIVWTIFKDPIMFIESEFKSFRNNVYFEDYRRPQPLYNRTIYRNFFNESLSTIPDYNCCPAKVMINLLNQLTSSFRGIYCSTYLVVSLMFIFQGRIVFE
jgi:carbonic anhydrase